MNITEKVIYYLFTETFLRDFVEKKYWRFVYDVKLKKIVKALCDFYIRFNSVPTDEEFESLVKDMPDANELVILSIKYKKSIVNENYKYLIEEMKKEFVKNKTSDYWKELDPDNINLKDLTYKLSKLDNALDDETETKERFIYEGLADRFDRLDKYKNATNLLSKYEQLDKHTGGFNKKEYYLFFGRAGIGKCLAKGTKVLMYNGTMKNVEDVRVGEQIMGDDSTPRNVLNVATGKEQMYKIIPVKGDPFICNGSHILALKETTKAVWHHGVKQPDRKELRKIEITVNDYLKTSKRFKKNWKLYRTGVEFKKQPTSKYLPPYFLGLWLGDGSSREMSISTMDEVIKQYLRTFANTINANVTRYADKRNDNSSCYNVVFGARGSTPRSNLVKNEFIKLNLFHNKHIPDLYKINSRDVRLQVLAGLIDSDGCLMSGCYEIITKFDALKEDILFLARSLGLAAYAKKSIKGIKTTGFKGEYWRIIISGDISEIPVLLNRKKASKRKQKKNVLVTGFKIEPMGRGDYYGFEIDGNSLFLLGDFTVTHNTRFLFNLAYNLVEQGYIGMFFSLEMYIEQMERIFDSRLGNINADLLKYGKVDREYYKDILQMIEEKKYPLKFIEHSGKATLSWLSGKIRDFKKNAPLDFVVVDYLGLMYDESGAKRSDEVLGTISKGLKNIAKQEDIVMITAAQGNRQIATAEREGGAIGLEHISQSDLIAHHCDFVAYVQKGKLTNNILDVIIVKNREGSNNIKMKFYVDFPTNLIKDAIDIKPPEQGGKKNEEI